MVDIGKSVNIMKALADSSRLLIIEALRQKPQYVEELAERLKLAVSTVSFHLKKLEGAGLVSKEKEQYYVVFHLKEEFFGSTLGELTSFDGANAVVQDERLRKYRQKAVSTFFSKGRLTKIPSQHKKRRFVMEEIIARFEPGRVYPEREVDTIIGQLFDDYCTVRRYFIDEKMMLRNGGNYQLNPDYVSEVSADKPSGKTGVRSSIIKSGDNKTVDNRKELIKKYKQTPIPMGVYEIRNKETGNIFVGSSMNLKAIFNRHKMEFDRSMHTVQELQEAWNRGGEELVAMKVIDQLEPKEDPEYNYTEDLATLEELWIDKLREDTGKNCFRFKGTRVIKS